MSRNQKRDSGTIRKTFLDQASQELLSKSPATSAYIGLVYLRAGHSPQSKENLNRCGHCGTILLPSWSCKRHKSRNSTTVLRHDRNYHPASTAIYKCSSCGNDSALRRRRMATPRTKRADLKPASTTKEAVVLSEPPATLNVSNVAMQSEVRSKGEAEPSPSASRKRAKSRKTAGLSALLAQSKTAQADPPTLDLMDFMNAG
ncbi:hypothetical protein ANO11243_081280 [Dothideomycetidae sp. 11243]|nr:hypothetical protein ANO11243_081280 [fungal sp. No.11243]